MCIRDRIGSTEDILNDPANDYVAQFIQDVDRTRVLTAGDVMEPPVALLGAEQGPRAAHRLMRQHQASVVVPSSRWACSEGSRVFIGAVPAAEWR